ncbi:hypothetical protein [Halorubrum sp. Atlit-26R]|uniref:hypothetical protein n=1 Tax=Halorubrum sp. Atlit-26R TaxID=2282128 RepID=UPI000EF20752|nr:hypothetical protein [Halorubrum sp. Atlit-26R]RLM68497.1 hypothetical protein DVK07_10265 [Halorubrum sp. Atlit-26R]
MAPTDGTHDAGNGGETEQESGGWETVTGKPGVISEREHASLFEGVDSNGHPGVRVRAKTIGVESNYRVEVEMFGGDRRSRQAEVATMDDPEKARKCAAVFEAVIGDLPDGWQPYVSENRALTRSKAPLTVAQADGPGRVELNNTNRRFSSRSTFELRGFRREAAIHETVRDVKRAALGGALTDLIESIEEAQ